MLKIKLTDGTEYEVIQQGTAVYPSFSTALRNRMEIQMPLDAMSFAEFERLFTDKTKTNAITLIELDTSVTPAEVKGEMLYTNYTNVVAIGKETVTVPNITDSSAAITETRLVVKLEQLTYIEQQLERLGVTV